MSQTSQRPFCGSKSKVEDGGTRVVEQVAQITMSDLPALEVGLKRPYSRRVSYEGQLRGSY